MLVEIPAEEFARVLDACANDVLAEAELIEPPVDAVTLARRRGLVVARDARMTGRARYVRIASQNGRRRGTILVGANDRPERLHWAVAHELGEIATTRVFNVLDVDPRECPPATREEIANQLAGRFLIPGQWLEEAGRNTAWELSELKHVFSTASYELIVRRMLDMRTPVVVTIFDQGEVHWRRSNQSGNSPVLSDVERSAWRHTHSTGKPTRVAENLPDGVASIACWPVHETDWQREIMRTELEDMW